MKMTERANKFALRFAKPRPVIDDRPLDQRMAEFHAKYSSDRLREARRLKKEQTNAY